ncbi:MAG: protein-disulfide reductase DsbD [Burkholderiaceae bacterium]|nr:protein-disulfide reductase DsbD [Burkholderiaceae bacterium]
MNTALLRLLASILLVIQAAVIAPTAFAQDFLPPEQAFRFEARAIDDSNLEIVFSVADGYYLYRDRFAFAAESVEVRLGDALIPAGKIKFDETFGKDVETHRGRVVIRVPVPTKPESVTLTVTSQGCADAGLCYPPMQSSARMQLAGLGAGLSVSIGNDVRAAIDGAPGLDGALRSGHLWIVAGVFFAAGLLLSLTPCVLPMLPILSSIIVGQSGTASPSSRSRGFGLALVYSLGMALVYTALGVAAGLAGEGLAATLQNPWVLGAFAMVLVGLALSMFGVYDLQLPAALRDRLDARASGLKGGRWAGVFAMGGLSALIVSPCVAAPLAGALLYISQSRDVMLGGGALFSLAVGMSVPLLLVGASAGALLPRAGAWMEWVKRFFGVLLLGVAYWIVSPVLPTLGAGTSAVSPTSDAVHFQRVRDVGELDAALRSAGRPVMLDFYADWCVSCKEMEHYTFSDPKVGNRLGPVLLLQVDVTRNSPEDKELLKRFNLFGPPGIVFFDARGVEIPNRRVIGYQNAERFLESLAQAGL